MGPLKVWLYSFHVPLFFFLSGLLFVPRDSFRRTVVGKARQLLVPYYIYGLISVIIYALLGSIAVHALGKDGMNSTLLHNVVGLFYGNGKNHFMDFNLPLWFLPVLFCLYLIGFFVSSLRNHMPDTRVKRYYYFGAAAIFAVIGYCNTVYFGNAALPFGLETAVNMAPFFFIGLALSSSSHFKIKEIDPTKKTMVLAALCFALALLAVVANARFGIVDYVADAYRNWFLFYLGVIGQGIWFVVLFAAIRSCWILEYIGKHTMSILVLHKYPIVFSQVVLSFAGSPSTWLNLGNPIIALAVSFASIALCLLLERFFIQPLIPWSLGIRKSDILPGREK